MKRPQFTIGSALLVLSLAACSGGGGALPSAFPAGGGVSTASHGTGSVIAKATVSGGVSSTSSHYRRISSLRQSNGVSISAVEVDGTLYPGYAGSSPVTNQQTLVPVNGQISIDMTFSNVPAGNNEWMILRLYAIAPDGSKYDLGQLASLVNVSSGQSGSVTLSAASAQTFEVFAGLLAQYVFSSTDLQQPDLATKLARMIAGANQTPDAATQLYTPLELNAIDASIAKAFQRTLSITSDLTSAPIVVVGDYSSAAELALQSNRVAVGLTWCPWPWCASTTSFPMPTMFFGTGVGAPCFWSGSGSQPVTGPNPRPSPKPDSICTQNVSAGTVSNVYGGPLLVGGNNSSVPFKGAWVKVPGIAAGQTATAALQGTSTDMQITVKDPVAYAFPNTYGCGPNSSCDYSTQTAPAFLNQFSPWIQPTYNSGGAVIGTTFAASNTVDVNTWGNAGEPLSALLFCTNENLDSQCQPLPAAGGTLTVQRQYYDSGSNFAYYNYLPGSGVTSVQQGYTSANSPQGMVVVTGGSQTGTFTGNTPTYMGLVGSTEYLGIDGPCCGSLEYDNSAATGTGYGLSTAATWSVTITDSNGNSYTGTTGTPIANNPVIQVNGLNKTVQVTKIAITYNVPNGTAVPAEWGIIDIYAYNQNNNSGGCCLMTPRHSTLIHKH